MKRKNNFWDTFWDVTEIVLRIVFAAFGVMGFLLIIGSAGALDCENITLNQFILQSITGLASLFASGVLAKIFFD